MTDETIVAVYDSPQPAALAVRDLEAAGIPAGAISQHADAGVTTGRSASAAVPVREQGFWASLFGGEPAYEHDTAVYDRSLKEGSTVVTVKAAEQHLTQVMDILERHNPIDMYERATSYGLAGRANSTTTTTTTAPTASPVAPSGRDTTLHQGGEEVIPLTEEELTVGKRLVNRGTTRIRLSKPTRGPLISLPRPRLRATACGHSCAPSCATRATLPTDCLNVREKHP